MSEVYSTSDIWLGAYFLSERDTKLVDFQVSRSSRTIVSFVFSGKNLTQLAQEYCQEEAEANIVQLRSRLNYLRDIIFESTKRKY
ncbi:MAG: hypothetical protein DHS20C13_29160 [Thermodesulfobacteriota bacterium]|nr:MAG: hypothetical protein DHS20C13_29160 [Thermodesulfobacteriota bacterium]